MKFMQRLRKLFASLLVVSLMVTTNSLEVSTVIIQATKVTINKTKVIVKKDKTVKLKIYGTKKKVNWTSSDKKVAVINENGKVTAKKKGKTVITAKVGGKKYICKVTVIGKNDYNAQITEKKVRSILNVTADAKVKITYGKKYYREAFGLYLVDASIKGVGKYEGYIAGAAFDVNSGEIISEILMWGKYHTKESENVSEDQVYVGDFNLYKYRADIYLKNDTICNRIIQNMLSTIFPSQLIVDRLDSKKVFQDSVKAWKGAHFATSPSKIAEGGIDEQGYYTAIILSVFKAETNHDIYMYDSVKKVNSDTNKILSNMKKWVREADEIELEAVSKNQILTTISISDQSKIRAYLSKELKKNHPVLNNSSTITSDLATIFDSVSTLGEAIELMESYIQIAEMADNMKTVLLEMHEKCPNSNQAMKVALYEAALSSANFTGALSATIINTAGKETEKVLGILIDEGWEKLIKSSPYAKAFMIGAEVGTWLGDTVCSTLFSTDKTIEQYEKMKCLSQFTKLLRGTVTSMGNTYLCSKSTEHADNYFAAVDALFSAGYLSCDFAADYGKILYENAALGWVSINKESYEEYMKSVKAIKGYYGNDEESLVNNYLAELECDYPEIYTILMGMNGSDKVPISGIENGDSTGETGDWDNIKDVIANSKKISLGWEHSGVITKDRSLYMWGGNRDG